MASLGNQTLHKTLHQEKEDMLPNICIHAGYLFAIHKVFFYKVNRLLSCKLQMRALITSRTWHTCNGTRCLFANLSISETSHKHWMRTVEVTCTVASQKPMALSFQRLKGPHLKHLHLAWIEFFVYVKD